jgi:serine/threonine protein kinase
VSRVLTQIGLVDCTKITDTLQGSIWRAWNDSHDEGVSNKPAAIKITNQQLHKHSISIANDKIYHVNEDILLEQSILRYLTQQNCPKSIVKFHQFFKTDTDYYLVMEDGGSDLWYFLKIAHKLIKAGKIELNHWKHVCKIIFTQMIECIDFIHSKNVCHFDISLENFLINDVQIEIDKFHNGESSGHKVRFVLDDIQIKLCDFGLAQLFTKNECFSSKYCGKILYKSPEVISKKKRFDAKANDIWCVGIALFSMVTGVVLWRIADRSDNIFNHVINGNINRVIQRWNLFKYVDDDLINLFHAIFKYEQDRITLTQIKQHEWLKP